MLTLGLIWAEKTSERELDGVGWSSGRTAMAVATETFDSARIRLKWARGGAEWGRGEVARLWVRGIEAEWRGAIDAELGGGSSSPLRDANARKEKGETKPETAPGRFEGVREDKSGAQTSRSGAIADAWTSSPAATAAVWAAYEHSRRTGEAQ